MVVKEEVMAPMEIPEKMKPLLVEYKEMVPDELHDGFPPIRDIQNHIDLIL
jgi:hypothetical protein